MIAKNLRNVDTFQIIEILTVLYSIHMVPKNQDKVVFYVNNYIN